MTKIILTPFYTWGRRRSNMLYPLLFQPQTWNFVAFIFILWDIFQSKKIWPWTEKKETGSQANAGISRKGPFKYPIVFALKFHDILVMISWSNSLQRFKSVASMVQEIHEWAAHISPPPLSSPPNYGNQKKVIQSEVKHKFFLFRQWDDLLDHAWKYLGDNDLNFPHLLYNFKFVIP